MGYQNGTAKGKLLRTRILLKRVKNSLTFAPSAMTLQRPQGPGKVGERVSLLRVTVHMNIRTFEGTLR